MPVDRALASLTIRELLESVSDLRIPEAAQYLEAAKKLWGISITYSSAPGADVTDRITRQAGFVRSEWLHQVRQGRAFLAAATQAAVAGQFAHVQLWNGSARRLLVWRALGEPSVACSVSLNLHAAALGVQSVQGVNALIGGTGSAVFLRTHSAAAAVSAPFSISPPLGAGEAFEHSIGDGGYVEVPPQTGVHLLNTVVNVALATLWAWVEVDA